MTICLTPAALDIQRSQLHVLRCFSDLRYMAHLLEECWRLYLALGRHQQERFTAVLGVQHPESRVINELRLLLQHEI